jgi:adenine/guanine phosphoribosyltransferase-like PRPP-binding protein
LDKHLIFVRKGSKIPPLVVKVKKRFSYVFEAGRRDERETIEMARDAIPIGTKVVAVDDILANGTTLYAVLELLIEV